MSLFWNKGIEGHETEKPEVKPRNQILQTPEKKTAESSNKLNPSERNGRNAFQQSLKVSGSSLDKERLPKIEGDKKLSGNASEGDPTKGQRQRERGHVTERE